MLTESVLYEKVLALNEEKKKVAFLRLITKQQSTEELSAELIMRF